MTRRSSGDEVEAARVKPVLPTVADQLAGTMFDVAPPAPAWTQRWSSLTDAERRAQRERWQAQLLPIVTDLATKRGPEGITASDVISAGITAGVLNGEASFLSLHPKVYAFVGPWLAQLARAGTLRPKTLRLEGGGEIHVKRESTRDASHGNAGLVYIAARAA